MNKPDITKEESGLQQNDGLKPSREPSLSYNDGKCLAANDIGDRSEKEDRAMNEAMRAATGNRRDQQQNSEADFPNERDSRPVSHVGGGRGSLTQQDK